MALRGEKQKLRDNEERMRAVLETAVEGIITIDDRGVIESFNLAAEKIFGYAAAEVIGRKINQLMPAPDRDRHDDYLANYLRTGHAKIIGIGREVVGQRRDGSLFPMELSVSEVRLADRMLFTGFVRDITERKRLERDVLEISETERQRIGRDLHDGLCQHLAGIEFMSQVLEERLSDRDIPESAQAAEISRLVRDAITQTRDLARGLSPVWLESGRLEPALEELARTAARQFKIRCRFRCEGPIPNLESHVVIHLYRIAQEAINNAIRHGKATAIQLRWATTPEKLLLTIDDNGTGLSEAAAKSTGMGIRIMRSRAGMIGGQVEIRSTADGSAAENTSGTMVVCEIHRLMITQTSVSVSHHEKQKDDRRRRRKTEANKNPAG